jgi:hypothetical protein
VRAEGDQLVFAWEDGKEQRGNLEKSSDSFTWDLGIFTPVEPFDDESPLVGRWEGGASSAFGGNTAVTSNVIDLAADGTFRGASAGSIRSESDESVVSGGGTADHAGRWELDRYSLVLTYGDGRTVRGITFPYDDDSTPVNPDRFYFAGIMYRKL